jgi:protein-tyrosine phosphatase
MDMSDEDIISHLDSAVDFMVDARGKGNVLVHCAMGVSRSASMVIAYLVREHQMSLAEALAYLKEKRSCIKPNRGFMKQLRLYTTNLDLDGTIPREFYV